METAKSDLKAAKILSDAKEYRASNNRAYYAIFHAISAIHALDQKAYKKHKDAIGGFNRDYIKTEIFSREIGRKISRAEEIRHASDYDDFYVATRERTQEQVETAEELIKKVEEYCKNRLSQK
ncbi:MAG: HEPN domain-containing protein [Muribaculum sp.]|nr:HEPN domain-containing protein [Muribaculum sp.]